MTPEKHKRAGYLFHVLKELPKLERDNALHLACAGDDELRDQVIALLEGHEQVGDSFLNRHAIESAAVLLASKASPAQPRVRELIAGRYRTGARIGAGGMGVVYEAEDLRLGRRIALKLLAADPDSDRERYARFQREVRAASHLNHPHIVSIYDAGTDDGLGFIAMELVEGQTLRQRITSHSLTDSKRLLDVIAQTASALSAAHAAGIIHRDIKPENIILRPDGAVKVLDFGLARLGESDRTPEPLTFLTQPGQLPGTVRYLSPEQVLGKPFDPRSDIFSLGVVAYELATGVRPFEGVTDGAIFDAILHRDPKPLSQLRPELDPGFDALIMGALEKDPNLRIQSADELVRACQRIGKRAPAGTQNTGLSLVAPRRRPRLRTLPWALAPIAAIAAALWLAGPPPDPTVARSAQLTNGAEVTAFINDGTRVYYSTGAHDSNSLMYQVGVQGGISFPIQRFKGMLPLDISPDRAELLMGQLSDRRPSALPVWAGSLLGGAPRRLGDIQAEFARWSSDAALIVYTTGPDLLVARADGSAPRTIFHSGGHLTTPFFFDGDRRIRFTEANHNSNRLWQVNANGTDARLVLPAWDGGLQGESAMSADGRYSVLVAGRNNHNWDLWAFRESTGLFSLRQPRPFRLTAGLPVVRSPQWSPDGRRVFFIGDAGWDELVRLDPNSSGWQPYLGGVYAIQLDFSRDGEWVTYVAPPGHSVWRSRIDGSESVQLTTPPLNALNPRWSPDGSKIVFYGGVPDQPTGMFLLQSSGGPIIPLTAKGMGARYESEPSWSPDGNQVLYGLSSSMEVIDVRTRAVQRLPGSEGIQFPRWSPDGKYAAAPVFDGTTHKSHLELYDMKTYQRTLLTTAGAGYPSWSRDSRSVYFENDACSIWYRVDISDRKVVQIASLLRLELAKDALGWVGMTPEGSVISARNAGAGNIYALDLQIPGR